MLRLFSMETNRRHQLQTITRRQCTLISTSGWKSPTTVWQSHGAHHCHRYRHQFSQSKPRLRDGFKNTHLFLRARKKDFPFSCGATPSRTHPLQVAFSLQERVDLRSLKEGDFGEEDCLGKGVVDRAKKGKKDAQKKVGNSVFEPSKLVSTTTLLLNLEEKELGPQRFRPSYANQSSEPSFPFFLGKKTTWIRKKEGFARTPPNRYGPSSSLSIKSLSFDSLWHKIRGN